MFSILFNLLIDRLLPWFLFKPKTKDWLYSLVKPLKELHETFKDYRDNVIYALSFTGQVIYLEHLLNDKFDNSNRGIWIDTLDNFNYQFIFNKIEAAPKRYFFNKSEGQPAQYIFNKSEYQSQNDFIINVPIAVGDVVADATLRSEIIAQVNVYRQAGKRFNIINY